MNMSYCKKNKIVSVKMKLIDRCRLKDAINEEDFDYLWDFMDSIDNAAAASTNTEEGLITEVLPTIDSILNGY